MKDKIVARLLSAAKKHEKMKQPILGLVAVIIAINCVISPIVNNTRRIVSVFAVLVMFVMSSSFAFAGNGSEEFAFPLEEKVFLESEDGTVEAQEIDMTKFSATEEDVEALSKQAENGNAVSKDPGVVDADTRIYDEVNGYTKATFEDDWQLILINKENPIPEDYAFELGTIRGNIKSDIRVIEHVLEMIQAAKEDGVTLAICSPYRDYDRQVVLFNRKVKTYMKRGMEEDDAYELASQTVAIPGTSEHQAGLAFDFISDDYTTLDAGFENTAAGKWLKENGMEYGFILRYPKGKEEITEIEFEPWHYRYVGVDAAREIMSQEICLEEYVKQIGLQ